MPYFDDRTYAIGDLIDKTNSLQRYAKEFYFTCLNSGKYPQEILDAEQQALISNNLNELAIMADATTQYALHMEKAYDREYFKAKTRQEHYELICITLAAVYTYRYATYRHGETSLSRKVFYHITEYMEKYGEKDLFFAESFIARRTQEMHEEHTKYQAAVDERLIENEKKRKQEEIIKNQQKEQREKEREAKIQQEREEQKKRQIQRNEERQIAIEQFRKKPLYEQLQTVVSNKKVPAYYGIDYSSISDSDLRSVPKTILINVITSFMTVKDPDWKALQKKVKRILAE